MKRTPSSLIEVLEARVAPALAVLPLAELHGGNGFKLSGATSRDYAGNSVSSAGDVNGDGIDDIIIAAPRFGVNDVGATYVVFGRRGPFSANMDLSALDGSNGFRVTGAAAGDVTGGSVSSAGDFNGDGFDDLLIGAPGATPTGPLSGAAYVLYGKAGTFEANVNVSSLDGTTGFRLTSAANTQTGATVRAGGDINGDGFGDIIINARIATPNGAGSGATYVVFGRSGPTPATLNLVELDGVSGFMLAGESGSASGQSVDGAGDVNGDGFADILIGGSTFSSAGSAYVVFGKASSFPPVFNLSSLNGTNGFRLEGPMGEYFGNTVASAGDLNGDGYGDVVVGALLSDANGNDSGAAYVLFGKASGFAPQLSSWELDGNSGFKIIGARDMDGAGGAVASAGDFNNDGYDDLLIGALSATPSGYDSGEAYLIYGKSAGFSSVFSLADLNGANGFKMTGVASEDRAGIVSAAGDLNADGYDDVIIGAFQADPHGADSGAAYIVFGSEFGPSTDISISDATVVELADGANFAEFTIRLQRPSPVAVTVTYSTEDGTATTPQDYTAVRSTIVFAPGELSKIIRIPVAADPIIESNETFIVRLSDPVQGTLKDAEGVATILDGSATLRLSATEGEKGFKITGGGVVTLINSHLADAGDINGDGHTDLILTAPNADYTGIGSGAYYVILGKADMSGDIDVSALNGSDGFKISGVNEGNGLGGFAASAGDLNGDGFNDLVIGAYSAGPHGFRSGSAYVIFGKPTGYSPEMHLSSLNGVNGFRVNGGAAGDLLGQVVGSAGDVNGDGLGDLLLAAPEADPDGRSNAGTTYVLFGKRTAYAPVMELSALSAVEGFRVPGISSSDRLGAGAAGIGDINHDGVDDLIIGAPGVDNNGANTGATYVVFGRSNGFPLDVRPSTINGTTGFAIYGGAGYNSLGGSVAAAGDVNNDGIADLIIGAPNASPDGMSYAGAAYIIFGKRGTFGAQFDLATLNGANGFALKGGSPFSIAGVSVSSAADFNGDGYDDLVVGAPLAGWSGFNSGAAYIVFGRAAFPASLDLSALDGGNGIRYIGDTAFDQIGYPVGSIRDLNGDGLGDVIVSTTAAPLNGEPSGTSYVVYGNRTEVSVSDALTSEGTTGMNFTISLSRSNNYPVTVQLRTNDGTAQQGMDYESLDLATLTFAPGETSKVITVPLLQDAMDESDEVFTLELANAYGAVIVDGSGRGTILDADAAPSIQIEGGSLLEGNDGSSAFTFTISLTAPSALSVSVAYATLDGTAVADSDYVGLPPGTLTFSPGETSKTVAIEILGDRAPEASEVFSLILSDPTNAVLDSENTGTGMILNDDLEITGKRSVRFADVDGDVVTVKVSRGALKVEDFSVVPSGVGYQLVVVDFEDDFDLSGTNITITAKPAKGSQGGDGLVHVGYINASGVDLGKVMIDGDLGRIDAGGGGGTKPAIKKFTADSIGAFGVSTQLPGGDLQSEIAGKLKSLTLAHGLHSASIAATQDIGTINIKGDVKESAISSGGRIGVIKIAGDLIGTLEHNASISAIGVPQPASSSEAVALGSIKILGSVERAIIGAGFDSGGAALNGEAGIGTLRVGGDWSASSVVAGVSAGEDGNLGTADDRPFSADASIAARIASIVIQGALRGSPAEGEYFGFLAREIGSFKHRGEKFDLVRGAGNDLEPIPLGDSGNLVLREVTANASHA